VHKKLRLLPDFLRLDSLPALLAVAYFSGAGALALAQSEPEEKLEPIELGNAYGEEDPGIEDEVIDGLVFDQDAQQYRLIEEDEEDLVEAPSQRDTDTAEIVRLFELYKESVGGGNYLEADILAKQIIELSIRIFGINSTESAKSLTNLAIAQHGNQEYEAAERNFRASIDIIERISDRLNEALINPLKGLGATQLAIGKPDMARQSFQRAVHVSHVNSGPHNLGQIEVLESMAEIYVSVGEHKQALGIQEKMYSIQARNLEPLSLEILPALRKQARWQHRLQMYDRERVTWRRVVNVLERHHGKNDLRLIPPLTSLGKSYLFITPAEYDMQPEVSIASGESYLRRANRIADSNPDTDWRILEQTLLALGDYYVLSGRPNRATRVYGELWAILSDDESRLGNRRDNLERINILQDIFPPRYYRSEDVSGRTPDEDEFETGIVSYGFSVSASGRPTNIRHIETLPPEFKDMSDRVRRNLRHLVYRPRVKDGKVVETPEMTYTHEFFYRASDIPARPVDSDSTSR